jgi:uncharacterized protein (TIGR02466 family)
METVTRLAPGDAAAYCNLGVMRNAMGDLRGARSAFQVAESLLPGDVGVQCNLGITLDGLEAHEAARAAFLKAVRLAPRNVKARLALAHHHARYGDPGQAMNTYLAALELDSSNVPARLGLARSLTVMGRTQEALGHIKGAIALDPGSAEAQAGYAECLDALNRAEEALTARREAVRLAPSNAAMSVSYALSLHWCGDPRAGIGVCDAFLARYGCNIEILSLLAFLHHEAGDAASRDRLLDFQAVREYRLAPPADYRDADEFLHELIHAVTTHPTLRRAPSNHATRHGMHSAELFTGEYRVFNELERQLRAAVEDYAVSPALPDVPVFRQARPVRYKLASWSVIMESQGHQVPHIHPSAWASGVAYLQVPDVVEREDGACSGWIEFGLPPEHYRARAAPHVNLKKPEPGKFFLFPAYYFHRTIPFCSDTRRICIAFDAVPVGYEVT